MAQRGGEKGETGGDSIRKPKGKYALETLGKLPCTLNVDKKRGCSAQERKVDRTGVRGGLKGKVTRILPSL